MHGASTSCARRVPDDVARLVAAAVDARGADPLARAIARLRDGDACPTPRCLQNPSFPEAARVASAVLAECPDVRVLATSREVLHVPGEVRFAVEPLVLLLDSDDVAPAVQLFVDRARAARPRFDVTPAAADTVAEICRLVDGLPLAIELAAARLNALGLEELLLVVERRLALLRERTVADAGHAALGALVEWSYDLLHEDEKSLLHGVAVQRGGASLPSLVAARREPRARRGDGHVPARCARRQVHSVGVVPRRGCAGHPPTRCANTPSNVSRRPATWMRPGGRMPSTSNVRGRSA